jgi:LysR family cys regulon transcriptional activator
VNIRQLRSLCEVLRHGLHISEAAKAVHASQSGVSKQILELEHELGVTIFARKRNRIVGITEPGRALVTLAQRIVRDADTMREVAADYGSKETGRLVLATTQTHARYTLPRSVKAFTERYPRVEFSLRAETPDECCRLVADSQADLAITTHPSGTFHHLVALPAYKLARCLVMPAGNALADTPRLTLQKIARYPLITYDSMFSSRRVVNQAFADHGLAPHVSLSAVDPDICKKYVALGMGVAILPKIAFEPDVDKTLRTRDVSHLFDHGTVNIYLRREGYLRRFVYDFVALFAPHVERSTIERALQDGTLQTGADDDLPFAENA